MSNIKFTDKDLDGLKTADVSFHLIGPRKRDALVQRLQAAEACAEHLQHITGGCVLVEIWKKEAGK